MTENIGCLPVRGVAIHCCPQTSMQRKQANAAFPSHKDPFKEGMPIGKERMPCSLLIAGHKTEFCLSWEVTGNI